MPAAEQISVKTAVQGADLAVSQYLVALPHIAYGGGWRTQIVVRNTSSTPAGLTIYYFGNKGNPLSLSIGGVASDHTAITVPPNGEQTVDPDWQDSTITAGWAGLVYDNAALKIQGIFQWHNPADPPDKFTEATAPVVSQAGASCIIPMPSGNSTVTMPFDETEGRSSGYGFANTTNTTVTMTLTFYDQSGQSAGQYTQDIPGFGHDQFLLKDKVTTLANKKGIMSISGQGIVPLGFRFATYNTFTTWLP